MPARPPADVDVLTTPERLLPLLEGLPAPSVVGFEPTPGHLAIHVAELPPDDRAAAAGLFGWRAEPGWTAVGVVVEGRARSTEDLDADLGRVRLRIAVREDDRHAHRLDPLDPATGPTSGALPGAPPEGLLVDALLRTLGRPSTAPLPPPHVAVLAVWSHAILTVLVEGGAPGWDDLVDLHPGAATRRRVAPPSVEAMVEATRRAGDGLDWMAIHRRAASGAGPLPPDLERHEAAWMDAPMYARWALGALAGPATVSAALRANGCVGAAERFDAVRAVLGADGPRATVVTEE